MYLDHTIGELVEYLTTEGWMENSIIVVASDNGGCPSLGGSNYPLRGLKHSYWEGGVKVCTVCLMFGLYMFMFMLMFMWTRYQKPTFACSCCCRCRAAAT